MKSIFPYAPLLAIASVALAKTESVTLDIVNAQIAPDGFVRSGVTANGIYPGPLISANKGDRLVVKVNNKLTDHTMRRSVAMDFDGVFVDTASIYDEGTDFVTACPLGPNMSYTYELPLGTQTGTFWYHSQLGVQYVDGLRGPMVIYDPQDPYRHLYDVDDSSTIVQLGDWWQNTSTSLLAGYEATGVVPISDSGTVNGVGRYQGGPEVPWPVLNVVHGKRYRFRVINQSARNIFTISFDKHDFTIIEADGELVKPFTTDELLILAGQRYSIVLNANQKIANYWFNAPFVGGVPARNLHQNATLTRAILRYAGAPKRDPMAPMTLGPLNGTGGTVEHLLAPLVPEAPGESAVNLTFQLSVVAGQAVWQMNNISYLPPETPTLVKILDGANTTADFNATENTFILPANSVIQVDFPPSEDDESHPFHLHGNNFWVIKSNSSDVVNTVNPIKRDTVAVGAAGTTIRFRTDQPMPAFFHCHIFWHKQAGLASVMASGLDDIRAEVHPDAEWENLCAAYNVLPEDEQ
ncbi:Cu-oxidase-domain-containing protein [Vararia minispora EC-137]|uniref:Cu-oxidase-domain-containing protein n=1 Tax=Vararia minispora EC-137 TaxID=1314806 RepID=A0ACB8QFM5_9AGAM|nr:Cu-oxidase-domain-containing protein [Vararia minispora EC-137]